MKCNKKQSHVCSFSLTAVLLLVIWIIWIYQSKLIFIWGNSCLDLAITSQLEKVSFRFGKTETSQKIVTDLTLQSTTTISIMSVNKTVHNRATSQEHGVELKVSRGDPRLKYFLLNGQSCRSVVSRGRWKSSYYLRISRTIKYLLRKEMSRRTG